MYQYLLFDLDGTLTYPGIGITNSVTYALHKFDIDVSIIENILRNKEKSNKTPYVTLITLIQSVFFEKDHQFCYNDCK